MKSEIVLSVLETGEWMKAPAIRDICGITERDIRHIAEESCQLISGNEGYRRVDCASAEEIAHHVKSLRSRARKINARADAIECQ